MLETLPSPMWQGIAENSLQRYAEFKLQHMIEMASDAPRRLKVVYEDAQRDVEYVNNSLVGYRREQEQLNQDIERLRGTLFEKTDEQINASVEAIMALPYVVGTRLSAAGGLVVLIRVSGVAARTSYDVGDFEIDLQSGRDDYSVLWVRPCKSSDGDFVGFRNLAGFSAGEHYRRIPGAVIGNMRSMKDSDYNSLAEYIAAVHDKLAESPKDSSARGMFNRRNIFVDATSAPEPLWSGHLPGQMFVAAMRRYDNHSQKVVHDSIESNERQLKFLAEVIPERVNRLRDAKQTERMAKADYEAALANAASGATIDVMEIKVELEYILSLPGIMGVKFLETGEPVFHYRASNIYDGKRYDMGDHEVRFVKHPYDPGLAVLNVHPTRGRTTYTHRDSEYEGNRSWFCFGGRAKHLNRLFERGDFGSMMHMMVNTMNSLNEGDKHRVLYDYEEIPMKLVWHTGRKKHRQRPRRQPRNKAQRLDAIAVQAEAV